MHSWATHAYTHSNALIHTCIFIQNELSQRLLFLETMPLPEQRKTVVNSGVRLEYEKRLSFLKAVSRAVAGFCVGSKGVCIVPQCVQGQAVPLSTVT